MTASIVNCLMPVACVAVAASVLAMAPAAAPQDDLNAQAARHGIETAYKGWGRARISYDEEFIEATLAPEFYVQIDGQKSLRAEFISAILRKGPNRRLTRFDVDILTVQRAEDGWIAVIGEKVESEITAADGATRTVSAYWVTRDLWSKDGDRWIAHYSEAIGYQRWPDGEKPPVPNW